MKKNKQRKGKTAPQDHVDDEFQDEPISKKWFEELPSEPKVYQPVTEQTLVELKDEAKKCHDSEVANYNIKNSRSNPNYKWMKTIMSKGTVSDKIAACTVSIQDNPVCNLDTLQNLVNMVKVGKKKECTMAMDSLTELFVALLKPEQTLKPFCKRPLSLVNDLASGNAVTRRKVLSLWYFEDQLKELYKNFLLGVNSVAHDVLDANKEAAIASIYKLLLAGNPEQEKTLLVYLVNKLGDPSQKLASKAIYSLSQLLFKRPNMQGVVLNEVEKLLFRSNVSSKAQYYGLCFLSQFYLSHETKEVARRLIEVYFSFFKSCIKKGEVDSRMMSALLMGVNRAYPYAKLELKKISEHVDTMYRVVHVATFNISLHALSLLYQISDQDENVSDRFYSALYKKLVDPKLLTTTHKAMLLSLIYKAILKDKETVRVKVFVKRLLQLSLLMEPSFSCGVLYLVAQMMGKKPEIQALFLKQTTLDGVDDDEEDQEPDKSVLGKASWDHCANLSKKEKKPKGYNALSRNPLYAGGDFCAYTELLHLKNHHHPTVALYATNIMKGNIIKYSGDPLKDFTLIRFLERFVFKNPKKFEEGTVQGAHPTFGKRKINNPKGARALPVNSVGYLNTDLKNIPVEELFMFRYLRHEQVPKPEAEDKSDVESIQSEEFEDMLDKMAGLPDDEEEDLDFLNEIGDSLKTAEKNKKSKRKNADNEDEDIESFPSDGSDEEADDFDDEEADDLDDNLDEEMNEEDAKMFEDLDDDEDEEVVFSDEEVPTKKNKKLKKKVSKDASSLFASAEEFASLLDDEGNSKKASGSSNAFANRDKANTKQLDWEEKRNRWLHGFNRAVGKKNKGGRR